MSGRTDVRAAARAPSCPLRRLQTKIPVVADNWPWNLYRGIPCALSMPKGGGKLVKSI